jgi:hypothetical protein
MPENIQGENELNERDAGFQLLTDKETAAVICLHYYIFPFICFLRFFMAIFCFINPDYHLVWISDNPDQYMKNEKFCSQ